jgi:choline dehydrogenase-like flavoprotein
MLIDFDSVSEAPQFSADICIVGAGAAGITLALELIPTGKQILLLEGGGMEPSKASQTLYQMDIASPRYPSTTFSRLRYFGGSTNHWEGSVRSFDPIDFETRSWVPNSGWPISYNDLQSYYDRAFTYVEVGTRYRDETPLTEHLGKLGQSIAAAGFRPRVGYASPPTRFGMEYQDRLLAAPNVTIVTNANLLSIDEAQNRRSVETVTISNYKQLKTKVNAKYFVIALGGLENPRALLLSDAVTSGGIGNENDLVGRYFMDHPVVEATIFYPSPDFNHSWGTGYVNYQARNYLLYLEASEDFLRQHQLTNARIPLRWANEMYTSAGIESFHQITKAISTGMGLPHVLTHIWNIMKDGDLLYEQWRRQEGYRPVDGRADQFGGYFSQMMTEQHPDPENRVVLTGKRDAFGLRKGEVFWRVSQQEKDDFKRFVDLFAKGAGAEGLGTVRSLLEDDDTGRRYLDILNYGYHHMGTTRMSTDPKKGVVTPDLRIHGRENIYIAGSSVFPTSSHIPPTATIVALSIRLAEHLRTRLV